MPLGRNTPETKRGFTLIELLCVVAVIGVLSALVLASLGRVRESANRARCGSNLHQLALAMLLHANDHKGVFPSVVGNTTAAGSGRTWARTLIDEGLVPKSDVFACPVDAASIEKAPAQKPNPLLPLSYAPVNPALAPKQVPSASRRLAAIDRPAHVYMLTEWHGRFTDQAPGGAYWHHVDEGGSAASDLVSNADKCANSSQHDGVGSRHFAFMDGHVEYRDPVAALSASLPYAWGPQE